MTMRASALDAFGKLAQELLAPTHVSSHQRPTFEGLVATLHREHMDESQSYFELAETNEKKDHAKSSQPVPDHVATAKHTVQECFQDPVEDDPLQLCVIPPSVLTRNCACCVRQLFHASVNHVVFFLEKRERERPLITMSCKNKP